MVLSSLWRFMKRHRRKFVFCGVLVGGTVLLSRYAQAKFIEYQEEEAESMIGQAKLQHHFDSNQRTCNITILSLIPGMRNAIYRVADSSVITEQLKHRPTNKLELWENLKIVSFSRAMCAVYVPCLMIIELRILLNVIGGYMYLDTIESNDSDLNDVVATPEIQAKYLQTVQYLLGEGLQDFVHVVEDAVRDVMQDMSLKDDLPLLDVEHTLQNIRHRVEFTQSDNVGSDVVHRRSMRPFMVPADTETAACGEQALLAQLLCDTGEMLDSSDFHTVLAECLDATFSRLVSVLGLAYQCQAPSFSLPLAKLIPIMAGLVDTVCADAPNPFVQDLLLKEKVKDFAANVYEAFSKQAVP